MLNLTHSFRIMEFIDSGGIKLGRIFREGITDGFERTVPFCTLVQSVLGPVCVIVSLCTACLEKEAKEEVPRFQRKD